MRKCGERAPPQVWAPCANGVRLQLRDSAKEIELDREGDEWVATLAAGVLKVSAAGGATWTLALEDCSILRAAAADPGSAASYLQHGTCYRFVVSTRDGREVQRRDPYARWTDYDSYWCFVDDPAAYRWRTPAGDQRPFDEYMIYEMHVGSFTPEGTFAAAKERLKHVVDLNFTAVQVMPLTEHSDRWGYNPRQLLAVHGPYGTPDDFRAFVDHAHALGCACWRGPRMTRARSCDLRCPPLYSSSSEAHAWLVPADPPRAVCFYTSAKSHVPLSRRVPQAVGDCGRGPPPRGRGAQRAVGLGRLGGDGQRRHLP